MSDATQNKAAEKKAGGWAGFAVVGVVLLAAALGLQVAVASLELHFKKQPVELARPLSAGVPREIGPWLFVGVDEPMSHAVEEALGTEQYIQRRYVDLRRLDPADADRLATMDPAAAEQVVARAVRDDPLAMVTLHMAYYTGGVDTVPHIPDRCMVAGGFEPEDPKPLVADVPLGGEPGQVMLRGVSFVDVNDVGRKGTRFNVAYFFQVNGKYAHDPITGVRQELAKLTSRHGYFCKIELMSVGTEREAANAAIADFLSHAMPDIEAALPDWQQVQAGRWLAGEEGDGGGEEVARTE